MDAQARQQMFRGQVILAPLTKGGNLPFRRLAVELGATMTTGEMALAHKVLKGQKSEMALLRRAPEEPCFGVQLAGRKPDQLARAARIAVERGADFVDLNLGCPIDLFCRRGIGAALLEKPRKVAELVAAMRAAVEIPVTVKLRLGWDETRPRYRDVGRAAQDAGADAVGLHGRSRKQRYRRAADWDAVAELAEELSIPVIGNGDLLTWRDVDRHWKGSGCASVMLARGALIKPWLFAEIGLKRDLLLGPVARYELLRRYRDLALAHFGHDERGRGRVADFLSWHLDFFNRYRPVPSEGIAEEDHPLIQTRDAAPLGPDELEEPWHRLLYSCDPADRESLTRRLLNEVPAGQPDSPSVTGPASAILATA